MQRVGAAVGHGNGHKTAAKASQARCVGIRRCQRHHLVPGSHQRLDQTRPEVNQFPGRIDADDNLQFNSNIAVWPAASWARDRSRLKLKKDQQVFEATAMHIW